MATHPAEEPHEAETSRTHRHADLIIQFLECIQNGLIECISFKKRGIQYFSCISLQVLSPPSDQMKCDCPGHNFVVSVAHAGGGVSTSAGGTRSWQPGTSSYEDSEQEPLLFVLVVQDET